MQKIRKSKTLHRKASGVIPGGVNSPVRAFRAVGGTPRFIKKGEGSHLVDVDENRYLDFCGSWGPLILGHADPDALAAVKKQTEQGLTYGATTELEYRLAALIVEHVPHIERVRFVSSGTEAAMSAIRVARGYTGRDVILKFEGCYHGHCDHLLVQAGSGLATFNRPSSAGVPEDIVSQTAVLPLDNDDILEDFFSKHGDKLAAAIIEGIPANNGLLIQRPEFMNLLRNLTERHGALLIFDEVITGFRIGLRGAAGYYGIQPDLASYGKVIGGGMPVGAFGGRADIMEVLSPSGPVYQAGTLSGNPVTMAAGLATLRKLVDGTVYARLDKLTADFCRNLSARLTTIDHCIPQVGSIFWLTFQRTAPRKASVIDTEGIARFNSMHGKLLERGIYFPPSGYEVCFVSTAHREEEMAAAVEVIAECAESAP